MVPDKSRNFTADVYSSDIRFLTAIARKLNVRRIFCEASRVSLTVNDFCAWNEIEFCPIYSLEEIDYSTTDSNVGLSYGFGMIFTKNHIVNYEHGIWNFHPGDLPKYRGRHPITHAFLEGEKELAITIHQINEKIDLGILLAKSHVQRTFDDTEDSIIEKMLILIERETLDLAMANYLHGEVSEIPFFKYRSNFIGGITISDARDLSRKQLFSIAKSQSSHGGVRIGTKRYREAHFPLEIGVSFEPDLIIECQDGEMWLME